MILRARQYQFQFPRPAIIMGIVNVTPDSFSDGGQFLEPAAAIEHGLRLVEEGAEIIDVGGESTRPRATPVSEGDELRRVLPVIEGLASRTQALISIDTCKPGVAREALAAGAALVNDIAANRTEGEMWRVVAQAQAGYVAMHMQGNPQTMQTNPSYSNVVREVTDFLAERLALLTQIGIAREQIVLDVGIGFGKRPEHNLALLAGLPEIARLQRPLLIGVSRKSFLARGGQIPASARLPAGLACACWAVQSGVQLIRTHDVRPTLDAVRMTEELLADRARLDLEGMRRAAPPIKQA